MLTLGLALSCTQESSSSGNLQSGRKTDTVQIVTTQLVGVGRKGGALNPGYGRGGSAKDPQRRLYLN